MKTVFTIFCLISFLESSFSQDNNDKIEIRQEILATRIVRQIELNNIDTIFQYFDTDYAKSQKSKLKKMLSAFYSEYKMLYPGTKRGTTLVFPEGINLFRFRYFDSTGTALQLDLSFKKYDNNARVVLVEMVDRETLRKQREASNKSAGIKMQGPVKQKYPYNALFLLRNCSGELRTVTFGGPTNFFMWWAFGKSDLKSQKVVFFSKDSRVDTSELRAGVDRLRKSLPENFLHAGLTENWFENEPNEDSIWFIKIFAQVEKSQNIKIYSAYKVVFDGNDARIDHQRTNPKVRDVIFITEKNAILALEKKLKNSPKTK